MTTDPFLPTIAVLGCGWLGLPLAKALVAAGHVVTGSTTRPSHLLKLRDAGITPYLLRLGPEFTQTDDDTLRAMLIGADVLVLNVPPRKTASTYPDLLRPVQQAIAACGVRHILFVSSTSVYPDEPRVMTEVDAVSTATASSDLLRAESNFIQQSHWLTTVVRFGGLFGPARPPGRFLAGRQDVPNAQAPVNLIHLDDCVGLLMAIIRQQAWGYTFNACADHHPTRQEFYTAAAAQLHTAPPIFRADDTSSGKTISSALMHKSLKYKFLHNNLFEALKA
ncbi:SDR family oxidoreductase [Hymenobacter jejuensis]|uniref:SDR family oxidoreductase n=1 Tax=Hymenobacter jejuensis TaxID=2502781 RepID=A0A5B8A546_9BACT|nr:SDR family oxidoreductase [Hymenobacter jejuensis]QDA61763.1 SDR family oxidoreductase [Hymenobacter jejuensis]